MASILIVEDDLVVRDTMADVLQSAGYRDIALAADGVEGLAIIRSHTHRLVVLLDVMMPKKSGFDVLTDVVEDDELATRHAFILVTARAGSLPPRPVAERMAALDVAVPLLIKPFRRAALLQAVTWAEQRLA